MTVTDDLAAEPTPEATSLAHLLARVAILHERLRRLVDHRRPQAFAPDDPLRGMYLAPEHVHQLLAENDDARRLDDDPAEEAVVDDVERAADVLEAGGEPSRLRRLQRAFGLDRTDVDLLLAAALVDLDPRAEPILGFLNDDLTRKRLTVGTALALVGRSTFDARARARLLPGGALVRHRLIELDEGPAFVGRSLRVPERVVGHLLGDDLPDPTLTGLLLDPRPGHADGTPIARVLATGADRVYVRERPQGTARSCAADAAHRLDVPVLVVDLSAVTATDLGLVVAAAVRDARLADAVLVAGPVDRWREDRTAALPRLDTLFATAGPLVLHGSAGWDPHACRWTPVSLDAPEPSSDWPRHLGPDDLVDPDLLTAFSIGPEQMSRAVALGRALAAADGSPLTTDHVRRGARAHSSAGLEERARRMAPAVGLTDMVLRDEVRAQLEDLVHRVRHRGTVMGTWGMRPGGARGRGVTALFAGDPGTGKTMAAEAIAHELGLDLYVVDLSTVVDKYIGETEKHLERIFEEADGVSGILLFDEADALFGKRSEVSDAHDRNANVEVAYLLQRMERFDGIALLTTNLRANLDEAFTRRLDLIVDFPKPDADERTMLWDRCLGDRLPRAADLDLEFCGRSFELAGGSIRAIAISSAYRAAAQGGVVRMIDVMEATLTEYRKLGRLAVASEFGPWLEHLRR